MMASCCEEDGVRSSRIVEDSSDDFFFFEEGDFLGGMVEVGEILNEVSKSITEVGLSWSDLAPEPVLNPVPKLSFRWWITAAVSCLSL